MGLNKSKGNMYEFVTHTFNTIKGRCPHDCSYCYMKKWGKQPDLHFDDRELRTDLGRGNFIFVGSSCDMWADDIPEEWITLTLEHCARFPHNSYLFQTKNPAKIRRLLVPNSFVCVTLETNRYYIDFMGKGPNPETRVKEMRSLRHPLYITIEPIMRFDLDVFVSMIRDAGPVQVNIGAVTGGFNVPQPTREEVDELIFELSKFTSVVEKKNLRKIR